MINYNKHTPPFPHKSAFIPLIISYEAVIESEFLHLVQLLKDFLLNFSKLLAFKAFLNFAVIILG